MSTYGTGTYGSGTYGTLGGATGDLDGTLPIVLTATLDIQDESAIDGSFAVVVTASLALTGGVSLAGTLPIVLTGTLGTNADTNLYLDPAVIRLTAHLDLPSRGVRRRVVLVDMDGSPLGELENADGVTVSWALNRPDDWSFAIGLDDPKAALVHAERFREVQIWRGDQLLTWGPIVRPQQGTDGVLRVSGHDCLWYLGRRNIGKADRTNYITNGSFEDGLTNWGTGIRSAVEPAAGRDPSFILSSVSTVRAVTGRYSARQEQTDPTYPKYGANLYQQFDWTVDTAARNGDIWTAAAQAYVPSADLDSIAGASLIISRFSTTDTEVVTSEDGVFTTTVYTLIEEQKHPMTPDFPTDRWVRVEAELLLPLTGATETVVIQLCSPKGVIFWDDASLTFNERLEFFAVDQATIAAEIVAHLEDAAFDKSDLNIGTACPLTGVLRDRTYLYSEHPPGLRSLEEFTRLDDGFDHRILYTPTTRTYVTEYPAAGKWRPKAGLELGGVIASYSWAFDGETAASSVVTLGSGSGSDREEGFAADTGDYANGLTLEEVFVASPETPVENLDNIAVERLAVTLEPQILEVTTIPLTNSPADRLLGYVQVGDVVPVTIRDGDLALEGDRFRIVKMTLTPDDTLKLTLNRRDVTV